MSYLPHLPLHVTPLMALGFILLIGAVGGYIAHRLSWLPSITGFIAVGFICGPEGLGILNGETIASSRIFIDVALALILYRLGLSFDIKMIRRKPSILVAALLESAATFGLVSYVLHLFGIPVMLAMLVASIAISSSPAVLLHVANEVGAKGPVTESAKALVALNNVISFFVFSLLLPMLHYSSHADWTTVFFQPLYCLVGSLVLGGASAFGLHIIALKIHEASQYKLALVIGAIMVVLGLAGELRLSVLFVPLVVGVTIKNLEKKIVISDLEFGSAFELFFIILFVFGGAGLHLQELFEYLPAVVIVVAARIFAKVSATTLIFSPHHRSFRTGLSSGLLLIPMAGLAIGLVQTVIFMFPRHASCITAIVLGAVALFETIGPPIASYAFRLAGESDGAHDISNTVSEKETE
jgi:Kef-type K+ transport system membrane component KefB